MPGLCGHTTFVKLTMWFDDVIIEGQDKCGGRLEFGFKEKDFPQNS